MEKLEDKIKKLEERNITLEKDKEYWKDTATMRARDYDNLQEVIAHKDQENARLQDTLYKKNQIIDRLKHNLEVKDDDIKTQKKYLLKYSSQIDGFIEDIKKKDEEIAKLKDMYQERELNFEDEDCEACQ